jgi:hypothetical protein
MDIAKAGQLVVLMFSPTLAVAAFVYGPRALRAVRRFLDQRAGSADRPAGPPIEQLAADLRRLLWRHESLRTATATAKRVGHLRALEAAIGDCAMDAARALGVPCRDRPPPGGLPTPELRRLLRALADAGLALPRTVDLLAADLP